MDGTVMLGLGGLRISTEVTVGTNGEVCLKTFICGRIGVGLFAGGSFGFTGGYSPDDLATPEEEEGWPPSRDAADRGVDKTGVSGDVGLGLAAGAQAQSSGQGLSGAGGRGGRFGLGLGGALSYDACWVLESMCNKLGGYDYDEPDKPNSTCPSGGS